MEDRVVSSCEACSSGTSEKGIADPAEFHFDPSATIVLARDVVLLRGMSPALQQHLCDALLSCPSFFECNNEKTRHIDMLHLGMHEVQGKLHLVAPIPSIFVNLAHAAHRHVAERLGMLRSIPLINSDVAVVNGYRRGAKLGMHVDRRSTKHPGIPVVAVSLGESAEFVFKKSWKRNATECRVILRSGDVLLFGGKARGIVHGMEGLIANSAPDTIRFGPRSDWCRVCITLRQS
ncbi:hypothetical protein AB1Y20_021906 [Prymnesium parvum]|uniref:Alpha-ketoglutarate-dependent dioxygenase AlkB-like domain-containing protein n=1 Tax=Prymnesium parvum TaxID=97485 RepID=A0AB34JHD7_PRYPA